MTPWNFRDTVELNYQHLIDDWLERNEFFKSGDVFNNNLEFEVDIKDLRIQKMTKKVSQVILY